MSAPLSSKDSAEIHVLIFTKYPTPGYAKTRLIPAVGREGAADISRQLTERMVSVVRSLLTSSTLAPHLTSRIYYASSSTNGDEKERMKKWLGTPPHFSASKEAFIAQTSGGLGHRLDAAFHASFRDGARKAVVVGADIPEIDGVLLEEAFAELDGADVVIGPAQDGGYYLLGMKTAHSYLFHDIPWSTPKVCEETIEIAKANDLSMATLQTLRDVDLPEDLPYFSRFSSTSDRPHAI